MTLVPEPIEPIAGLRSKAFAIEAADLDLEAGVTGAVWGVIMESGYPEALISLVVFGDGSASLYFGSGGGIVGAGAHAVVREASAELLMEADARADLLEHISEPMLPHVGEVRIYFKTHDGLVGASAPEAVLGNNQHDLSPLFHMAHSVMMLMQESVPER